MSENEVALLVDHESVEEPPDWMDDGEAESEQVGGGVTHFPELAIQVAPVAQMFVL